MRIVAYDPAPDHRYAAGHDIGFLPLHDLLESSDFVSLHAPLTRETHNLIGATELALMKPTAYLVNTARGALIDERALHAALVDRMIAGAGIDAFAGGSPANRRRDLRCSRWTMYCYRRTRPVWTPSLKRPWQTAA